MVRPGLDEPENPLVGLGTEVAWKLATPSRVPCGVVGREFVGVMAEPVDRRCWTIFWQAVNRHNRKKQEHTINLRNALTGKWHTPAYNISDRRASLRVCENEKNSVAVVPTVQNITKQSAIKYRLGPSSTKFTDTRRLPRIMHGVSFVLFMCSFVSFPQFYAFMLGRFFCEPPHTNTLTETDTQGRSGSVVHGLASRGTARASLVSTRWCW